ncbi:MAG: hypothetical protein ACRD11_06635 [Terriglobia bacterium]
MRQKPADRNESGRPRQPHQIRLPGFLVDEEIGLGDAIKRMTYATGIKACGGCEKRAQALNRWMRFSR